MKKAAAFPGRAWRLLRAALLWARRGGAFKRGFFVGLRLSRGYLKGTGRRADRLRYGEREFSIEDTPIFQFKTPSARLLRIPCITPAAPADFYDDDDDFVVFAKKGERSGGGYLLDEDAMAEEVGDDDAAVPEYCREFEAIEEEGEEHDDDDDDDDRIDAKAEEFIAKFHEQMRMQRQISLIQYNEMLLRSRC